MNAQIKSSDTMFADPIRLSQITDGHKFAGQPGIPGPDIAVIVAVYESGFRDRTNVHTVRGVRVSRLAMTELHGGRLYRWCTFPDGRTMLVNEGNIREHRLGGK